MNKVKASLWDWVVAWVLSVLELAGMVLLIGLLMAGCARCARCLGVEYGTTFVSPAPDGQVAPGAGTVTARCAGVDTATVYDGATVIGTLPYFPPYTLSHTWSGLGAHVLRAVGCDAAGRLVTNTISVVVVEAVSRTVAPGRSAGGSGAGAGAGVGLGGDGAGE